MKSFLHLSVLILMAVLFVCMPAMSFAQSAKPKILIIHSYSQGFPWTQFQMTGMQNTFEKAYPDLEVPVEYLDWKNYPEEENLRQFKKQLRYKYGQTTWDVIITTDNTALDLILELRQELFPGAFVVFSGINDYRPSAFQGQTRLTGVIEAVDYLRTINQMLKIHPKTKEIAVILDSTEISKVLLEEIKRLFPRWQKQVSFKVIHDLPMQQILTEVDGLSKRSLILVTNFTMDKTKKKFTSREAISMISKQSHVPVYGLWEMQLGYGIVGGWLLDGHLQGKIAADLALKALRGETPPIVTESASRLFMDYNQMKRFKIPVRAATEETILINYPEPIFKKYRRHIIVAAVTMLILFIMNIFLIINIRKRHIAEKERDQLLVQEQKARIFAEDAIKARETFMALAAHEFRTPLTVILFQLQLLLKVNRGETKKKSTKEDVDEAIQRALIQGRRIQKLVEDFLYVVQSNSPTSKRQLEETDMHEVVSKVTADLKSMLQNSGSVLDVKLQGPCKGLWERKKIERVVTNLLSNAIKFGNGRPIEVTVTAEEEGVKLIVKDHGIGILIEDKNKIFEKFGRAVSELHFGGFGLGLYVSQKIVEDHHGQITVESGPGQGTQFTVFLPYSVA